MMPSPRLSVDQEVRHDILVGVRKAEAGHIAGEPTQVQAETLAMIRAFTDEHKFSPSVRQIADALEAGISTISYRLDALVRLGYLRRQYGSARTLVVIDRAQVKPTAGTPCDRCGCPGSHPDGAP